MRILLFSLVLLLATGQACRAQDETPPPSWQTVRNHQHAGVHLLLALPKIHYYMGEVITATLTFSIESKDPYFLSGPSGGRSGRVNDVAFRGEGDDHRPIPDPLEWYLKNHFLMGGGGGTQKRLGPLEFSLAANQWLQFERPGTYQLYAWSSCLVPGVRGSVYDQRPPRVELVSDPVTITIEPLPGEAEKKIIEEATQALNKQREVGRFDLAFDALERLRFLQTPAASDALLQFVDVGGSETSLAFYGRPNYAASAAHILTLVQEGRLGLSENLLYLYSGLKSGSFLDFVSGDDAMQPGRLAREELFAAARRVIEKGGQNEAFFADLIAWYRRNPQDPAIRSLLIQRQLELTQTQIDAVFGERFTTEKHLLAEKDFLPLIRELSKPERHNPVALKALAKLAPEEAKPIILEDIRLNRPVFIPPPKTVYPNRDFLAFAALPDRELPELDPILREKLPPPPYDEDILETTMLLIDRYASKALLPDVLHIYETREGHWPCAFQSAVLRYWIRCDAAAGLEGLRQALGKNAPDETGCFRFVLTDVLQKAWVDEALPLVLSATTHEDLDVVRGAIALLEAHAAPESVEQIIVAIERIAAKPLPDGIAARHVQSYVPRGLTTSLLDNKRWTLTHPQIERLLKVATDPMLQTRLKSLLAGPAK
jgi:hypothetical protein